ncbi:BolA family transcriptional regulator [Rhodocyclus tenuis]|uniref:BolA/IbaG family iron-sulfur metabolism protein n=2 Tax=Rhodocyclus TaxID=1064 RepID=A0A6L5JY94_RHOTE|nr:BolA family protein [Rhodocyclus gracilis]MQY52001.1 BolA/IbaG family iron-sulfur metabolism protein [Rhodocyclus gracilis]MRD73613.1 BolA/IbaG family iron-sulfur metabolism protein [Rhodocyclus gracilis]NJA89745.1 BolA family transcriptional regulator [Rhodocyclus gracilis]
MSTPTAGVEEQLRERLAHLSPRRLEIIDESAKHAGHAGARNGGGHYRLLIVADAFSGLTPLARHRLVMEAVDDLMRGAVHALSIKPLAPEDV